MNNHDRFYQLKNFGIIKIEPAERVEALANMLIESLYIPTKGEQIKKVDQKRVKLFGIDDEHEPINWGDLTASVEEKDGYFLITIEEAGPGACPTLCGYIRKHLASWGWKNIEIQTEW